MKPEAKFVSEFKKEAAKRGWIVAPIPDPKGSYQYQQYRPFDFVLITDRNVFCIEAKANYNQLLSHQKGTAEAIEKVNSMAYWVIRKKKTGYSVEKFRNGKKQIVCHGDTIGSIMDHFEHVRVWENNKEEK